MPLAPAPAVEIVEARAPTLEYGSPTTVEPEVAPTGYLAPALEAEPAPVVSVSRQPLLETSALEAAHLHTHRGSTVKLSIS